MESNVLETPQIVLTLHLKDKCFNSNYNNYHFKFDGKKETSGNKTVRYVFSDTSKIIEIIKKIDNNYVNEYNVNVLLANKVIKKVETIK